MTSVPQTATGWDAGSPWRRFAHGRDWHYTEAEAIKRACEMRDRRVASLKKQIAAIAAMKFEVK